MHYLTSSNASKLDRQLLIDVHQSNESTFEYHIVEGLKHANEANNTVRDQMMAKAEELAEALAPRTTAYHEIWLTDDETGEKTLAAGGINGHEVEPIYGPTYLPRKFKTAFALPEDNCVDVYANDGNRMTPLASGLAKRKLNGLCPAAVQAARHGVGELHVVQSVGEGGVRHFALAPDRRDKVGLHLPTAPLVFRDRNLGQTLVAALASE